MSLTQILYLQERREIINKIDSLKKELNKLDNNYKSRHPGEPDITGLPTFITKVEIKNIER